MQTDSSIFQNYLNSLVFNWKDLNMVYLRSRKKLKKLRDYFWQLKRIYSKYILTVCSTNLSTRVSRKYSSNQINMKLLLLPLRTICIQTAPSICLLFRATQSFKLRWLRAPKTSNCGFYHKLLKKSDFSFISPRGSVCRFSIVFLIV